MQTLHQIPVSGKNKKNIINESSAELACIAVKVKLLISLLSTHMKYVTMSILDSI